MDLETILVNEKIKDLKIIDKLTRAAIVMEEALMFYEGTPRELHDPNKAAEARRKVLNILEGKE